jgi:tetratricopeptide (TPR) repeat protein
VKQMFCTSCGTKNGEEGNFCKHCGLRLDKPAHFRISEKDFERAMPEEEQITQLLERAYRARKDGDRLGAIALCLEALVLRPTSTSCHSLLGQLYEQGGERDLAIEQYERVLALNPGSIADRVKLDELRGDVPSIVSESRTHPHIVLADRGKGGNSLDYRVPAFVLAGVALMVLGGIFTMQMLTRQNSNARTAAESVVHSNASNAIVPSGASQGNSSSANSSLPQNQALGQSVVSAGNPPPYRSVSGIGGDQPIIIQSNPAPSGRGYSEPGYDPGPARLASSANFRPSPTTNSAQDDNKDFGGDKVRMPSGDGGKFSDEPVDAAPTGPTPHAIIKVNQAPIASQGSPSVTPAASTNSNMRKNEEIANLLAQQGQYKPAGDAYLRALDGAGDETAYIYRQAAWCFEKAGEKVTAVNYYKQGMDAAQKLVSSGRELEIAKNLIRACQTGIKACSN